MAVRSHARWLAAGLAATLAGPPLPAAAAPSKADRKLLDKVGALAQEAQTRFETADFAGAIELWTQAYAALPAEAAYEKRRNGLAYLIAQACVEAYAIDPQLVYLRKAEKLFEQYRTTVNPKDKDTAGKVEATLAELREKIRVAEEKEAAAAREQADASDEATERARRAEEEKERAAARRAAAERDVKTARRLNITGGVLAGVGAIGLGLMGYGLSSGARLDREGEAARQDGVMDLELYRGIIADGVTANRIAIVGGAVGGALLVTGLGLVAAGAVKQRRARRELAAAPTWLPGGAGLVLQGRF